jgi:hypothetical protein
VSIINDEVAVGDQITVEGTALGADEVSVSFYGPRGTYDRTSISVDSNGEFSEENVNVGGNLGGATANFPSTTLSQGTVVMSVFSDGRDGVPGDGTPPPVQFDLNGNGVIDAGTDEENSFLALYARLNAPTVTLGHRSSAGLHRKQRRTQGATTSRSPSNSGSLMRGPQSTLPRPTKQITKSCPLTVR